MSLNNEPCMIMSTVIDLNPIGLNYYPFMISLDKCDGSFNAVDGLSTKICVPTKEKDLNVKVFTMIRKIYEAKTLVKLIPCDCNCKFEGTTSNSNQKWNEINANVNVKSIEHTKKILHGILAHAFVSVVSI